MKKINKKGFTLIELLAVIVILGVIMVIAVPAVTKYIDKSRKDAFETSVKQLVDAANLKASNESEDVVIDLSDELQVKELVNKGSNVKNGKLTIKNGKVSILAEEDNYCSYKSFESNKVTTLYSDCKGLKNIWFSNRKYPITKNGCTLDYDYNTQTYTLNGTCSYTFIRTVTPINTKKEDGNFKLNDKYVIKFFYVGGSIDQQSGNSMIKMDFVNSTGSVAYNGDVQQQLESGAIGMSDRKSGAKIIDSFLSDLDSYCLWIRTWSSDKTDVVTYTNYRFKAYFGLEGLDEYIPNVLDYRED